MLRSPRCSVSTRAMARNCSVASKATALRHRAAKAIVRNPGPQATSSTRASASAGELYERVQRALVGGLPHARVDLRLLAELGTDAFEKDRPQMNTDAHRVPLPPPFWGGVGSVFTCGSPCSSVAIRKLWLVR